jgi:redox-sensing transcriptional repressor
MKPSHVSRLTTNRLSVYLRCLNTLEQAAIKTVSSRELAEQFHLNSAQIRKDLANFGEFGVRGVGYDVPLLKQHLIRILGLNKQYNIIIAGAGNLGLALAAYGGFNSGGFGIKGLFDSNPERVTHLAGGGYPAFPMGEMKKIVKKEKVNIAILAVPAAAGQVVLDHVVASGVRAILNFVPVRLRVPEGVELATVDLKIQMESLAYHLTQLDGRVGREGKSRPEGGRRTDRSASKTTRK